MMGENKDFAQENLFVSLYYITKDYLRYKIFGCGGEK